MDFTILDTLVKYNTVFSIHVTGFSKRGRTIERIRLNESTRHGVVTFVRTLV